MTPPPFDDRDGLIWLDGALVPWRDARVHVLTHALHYASAVFEGERVYKGQVFKLTEHSERLAQSGRILGFELPWTVAEIDAATRATVAANGIEDGYVRPIAWRGAEQMGVAPTGTKIHLAIATWVWPSYFPPELRSKGLRLTLSPWKRPHPETAPTQAKAAGLYMIGTLSKQAAEAAGYSDSILLDWSGALAEASGANLFLVMDGVLHTPVPDCFLDGITRRTVMALARARGFKVVERKIQPEELAAAQEAFLTGTAAEITPVAEIGAYRFAPGPVTAALIADYDALVGRT
ncbi:branched-chain-amino-acid aminotransferase [mine drainage metagenome]|uniref:branched-chain-amino-acid transaminase n=1 Tax=mine drainage metagenome TaxID=410659 RepID=A0A1J5SHH4_9ZZZZ